jgi:hypothetical protein
MTTLKPAPVIPQPTRAGRGRKSAAFLKLLNTTDHKLIGIMYMVTSFGFLMVGGSLVHQRSQRSLSTSPVNTPRTNTDPPLRQL